MQVPTQYVLGDGAQKLATSRSGLVRYLFDRLATMVNEFFAFFISTKVWINIPSSDHRLNDYSHQLLVDHHYENILHPFLLWIWHKPHKPNVFYCIDAVFPYNPSSYYV